MIPAIEVHWPFGDAIFIDCEQTNFYGDIRPEAVVAVGEIVMAQDGPNHLRPGWWQWFLPADWQPYTLDVGSNTLEFIAGLVNGSTISATVSVTCDPTLQAVPGFIRSLTPAQGSEYQLEFDGGTIDDQPDGWSIIDTERVMLDVDEDVLFVVHADGLGLIPNIYTAAELAELLSDCTPASDVPYEVLVDADGRVHQSIQIDGTLHFCLGE